jgi:hypothetical protein
MLNISDNRLKDQVRKNGFDYSLKKRGKHHVIYEQKLKGRIIGYEVFKIKVKPASKVGGVWLPAKERFPHNEASGKWARSFYTWERAINKFNELEDALYNKQKIKKG